MDNMRGNEIANRLAKEAAKRGRRIDRWHYIEVSTQSDVNQQQESQLTSNRNEDGKCQKNESICLYIDLH